MFDHSHGQTRGFYGCSYTAMIVRFYCVSIAFRAVPWVGRGAMALKTRIPAHQLSRCVELLGQAASGPDGARLASENAARQKVEFGVDAAPPEAREGRSFSRVTYRHWPGFFELLCVDAETRPA